MIQSLSVSTVLICILVFCENLSARDSATLFQLERDLKLAESHLSDLVVGTEKTIRWYQEQRQRTALSIVYMHGFSASRQELNPFIDQLADRIQANVYYTRLTGHGRSDDAMLDGSVQAWKNDTLEAYSIGQQIGEHVVVIGTSTGATLATWLSAQPVAAKMHATILISPNFGVKNRSAAMVQWRLGLWLAKILNGDYYSFTPMNDFHAQYWTERYPLDAVVPMLDLVDEVAALDKSQIATPQLVVYSPLDAVVNVEKIKSTIRSFSSAAVTEVPFTVSKDPAQHVLVGDAASPDEVADLLEITANFLKQLNRATATGRTHGP